MKNHFLFVMHIWAKHIAISVKLLYPPLLKLNCLKQFNSQYKKNDKIKFRKSVSNYVLF